MRKRGFTLMELTVYMFLAVLAGLALYQLYTMATRFQQSTLSSYLVSGDTETAIRWLRRDLQETALVSVRSYPGPDGPGEAPGCSFASSRNTSDSNPDQFNVNKYGAPLWTKYVYYTLQPQSGKVGDLVRWEKPMTEAEKDLIPHPSTNMPGSGISNLRRVVLKQVLLRNTKVEGLAGAAAYQSDEFGGFSVKFVRREGGEAGAETTNTTNPAKTSQGPGFDGNTSLLQVELKILANDKSKPSFYNIKFKVHPRY